RYEVAERAVVDGRGRLVGPGLRVDVAAGGLLRGCGRPIAEIEAVGLDAHLVSGARGVEGDGHAGVGGRGRGEVRCGRLVWGHRDARDGPERALADRDLFLRDALLEIDQGHGGAFGAVYEGGAVHVGRLSVRADRDPA